jgi:hypothetical protein
MKTGSEKAIQFIQRKTRNPQVKKLKLPLSTGGSFCFNDFEKNIFNNEL